jgi:phytoene dehydrogenase-like protein
MALTLPCVFCVAPIEILELIGQALERVIPDIRKRTELKLVGTPLTHERENQPDLGFIRSR